MKKILIIISLVYFTLQPKIALGLEIPGLPLPSGQVVPVIDEKAVEALSRIADVSDSILTLTLNELEKLNRTLAGVLETRFEEESNKVVTDSLKEAKYQEYAADILKFVKIREDMAKGSEKEKFVNEAKKANAYLGLIKLGKSIPCISPGIRLKFTNFVLDLTRQFNLLNKAQEVIDQIPDCEIITTPETVAVHSKLKFLAWLTEPFKLNLAQISEKTPTDIEYPPITITPAFLETEETIALIELQPVANNLIVNEAEKGGKEMEKQIGDIFPVMECLEATTEFDDGEYVCLSYKTLISGNELKDIKKTTISNNPLEQTTQDINIYQKFVETPNVIKKIGLATSSIATSSELGGILIDEKEIKEITDRVCGNFATSKEAKKLTLPFIPTFIPPSIPPTTTTKETENNPTLYYSLCLQQFTKKLQKYAEIVKKEIEQRKKHIEETKKAIDSAQQRAENLRDSLTNCPSAYKDLENLVQVLGGKSKLYVKVISEILRSLLEVDTSIIIIKNLSSQTDNLVSMTFTTSTDSLTVLNDILKLFKSILAFFGINLNESIIPDISNYLKNIKKENLLLILEIVKLFDKNLSQFANVVLKLNKLNYELYQSDFSRSDILNDAYQLQLTSQKLDAYERLAKKGGCSTSSQPEISLLNKNQVIVVESKKPEIRSFNFLALVKKLFQPKLVEIRNEK